MGGLLTQGWQPCCPSVVQTAFCSWGALSGLGRAQFPAMARSWVDHAFGNHEMRNSALRLFTSIEGHTRVANGKCIALQSGLAQRWLTAGSCVHGYYLHHPVSHVCATIPHVQWWALPCLHRPQAAGKAPPHCCFNACPKPVALMMLLRCRKCSELRPLPNCSILAHNLQEPGWHSSIARRPA